MAKWSIGPRPPIAPAVADDALRGHLEDVQRRPAADLEDGHPRVVALGLHLERLDGSERLFVEAHEAVEVGGDRGDVVEPGRDRHGEIIAQNAAEPPGQTSGAPPG